MATLARKARKARKVTKATLARKARKATKAILERLLDNKAWGFGPIFAPEKTFDGLTIRDILHLVKLNTQTGVFR
jgi:hypothetical protein